MQNENQPIKKEFTNECPIMLEPITKEDGILIFSVEDYSRSVIALKDSKNTGRLAIAETVKYSGEYLGGTWLLEDLNKLPVTQKNGEVFFIRLSEVPDGVFSQIFTDPTDPLTLLNFNQVSEKIIKTTGDVNIRCHQYFLPTPFDQRISEIKRSDSISMLDRRA